LVGAGASLLPYCTAERWPSFENLALENKAYKTLQALINQILPDEDEQITNMESRFEFVLKQVNDLYSTENIEQFKNGLKQLNETTRENHNQDFHKIAAEEQLATLVSLVDQEGSAAYTIQTTKGLCVEHFTRSEYFMKELMDFEFVPGRYVGCMEV
jgi:hypothetical protein